MRFSKATDNAHLSTQQRRVVPDKFISAPDPSLQKGKFAQRLTTGKTPSHLCIRRLWGCLKTWPSTMMTKKAVQ